MGMNFGLYKPSGELTKDEKSFDILRYSGDVDFEWFLIHKVKCDYIENISGYPFCRPKDKDEFNKCRKWIKENIYEGNQARLLKLMDLLEKDENLWLGSHW